MKYIRNMNSAKYNKESKYFSMKLAPFPLHFLFLLLILQWSRFGRATDISTTFFLWGLHNEIYFPLHILLSYFIFKTLSSTYLLYSYIIVPPHRHITTPNLHLLSHVFAKYNFCDPEDPRQTINHNATARRKMLLICAVMASWLKKKHSFLKNSNTIIRKIS